MSDYHSLVELARRLGTQIAQHPRAQAFTQVRRELNADRDAQTLLKAFTAQSQHIRQLEAEQKPIEVDDKRKLAELESQLMGNELVQRFMRLQADYLELMNAVNQALHAPLASTDTTTTD